MNPTKRKQLLEKAGLSDQEVEVLSLHCFDQFSLAQIAEFFGKRKWWAQERLEQAKKKLAKAGLSIRTLEHPKRKAGRPYLYVWSDDMLADFADKVQYGNK